MYFYHLSGLGVSPGKPGIGARPSRPETPLSSSPTSRSGDSFLVRPSASVPANLSALMRNSIAIQEDVEPLQKGQQSGGFLLDKFFQSIDGKSLSPPTTDRKLPNSPLHRVPFLKLKSIIHMCFLTLSHYI